MSRSDKAFHAQAPRYCTVPSHLVGGNEGDNTPVSCILVVKYRTNSRVVTAQGTQFKVPTASMTILEKAPEAKDEQPTVTPEAPKAE